MVVEKPARVELRRLVGITGGPPAASIPGENKYKPLGPYCSDADGSCRCTTPGWGGP